jgi:hypothetical protein
VRIARRGQVGPNGQRGVIPAELALELGDVPQRAEQQLVGQIAVGAAAERRQRLLELAGLTLPPAERHPLGAVVQRRL